MADRIRKSATNSTVYRRTHRHDVARVNGNCERCPPHDGENRTHRKHGTKKPKRKNHRRPRASMKKGG